MQILSLLSTSILVYAVKGHLYSMLIRVDSSTTFQNANLRRIFRFENHLHYFKVAETRIRPQKVDRTGKGKSEPSSDRYKS